MAVTAYGDVTVRQETIVIIQSNSLAKTAILVWFTLVQFPRCTTGGKLVPHWKETRVAFLQRHQGHSPSIEAASKPGVATEKVQHHQDSNHLHEPQLVFPPKSIRTELAFELLGGQTLRQMMGAYPTLQC